jgi:hypothetical protein
MRPPDAVIIPAQTASQDDIGGTYIGTLISNYIH